MDRPDSPQTEPVLSSVPMRRRTHPQEDLNDFKGRKLSSVEMVTDEPDSLEPGPSCMSLRSDWSKSIDVNFKRKTRPSAEKFSEKSSDVLSLQHDQQHQRDLNQIFMRVEENIFTFEKNELKKMLNSFNPDYSESSECQRDYEDVLGSEEQKRSSREAFLKLTVNFLKIMKQEELAACLQSKHTDPVCEYILKLHLKKKFQCVFEGIAKPGNPVDLNQIYTEIYIIQAETGEINNEHEVRQIETFSWKPNRPETTIRCEDIFKAKVGLSKPIRTVVTTGVAGIGKTVLTQKFVLDWAEGKTNQDIQFLFPFTFREVNLLKDEKFSLVELIHFFFTEIKEAGICSFENFKVAFIFDGLDECRLPLDFNNNEILTDVTKSTSVDVLLTNIIRGKLLPSAQVWITTRPAGANQIPAEYIDMVTEVRGFTNPQKEEYFRKRFRDEEQPNTIISHIKTSQSLHIMCHIPIFCWITATVLENILKSGEGGKLPKTLTQMYIHFLVVQTKVKNIKYDGRAESDPHWTPESKNMIEELGKLAFEQLQKGNLIFYESDLKECEINIREASVNSGVLTQIIKEESGLYQENLFCFVHLSIQEFLAALYVHLTFTNSGINLLEEEQTASVQTGESLVKHFYQSAVDKALLSPNGHLDLFLRFLLGLSLQTNQTLLQGLLTQRGSRSQINQEIVEYINNKISENLSTGKTINLFHCLNELNEHSIVKKIQHHLNSGTLSTVNLSPAQWSALVFILLSSEKDLDVFELKKYVSSDEAIQRLLPVVKASKKVLLSDCNLTERSCEALSSVLSSYSCRLIELDMSNNDLYDSGVELLCSGLGSQDRMLETLRLSGCLITKTGCVSLASVLRTNCSHLKELDLSYNHPEDSGMGLWSPQLEDHNEKTPGFTDGNCVQFLEILRVKPQGTKWLRPGLKKYFCDLTLDPNTAHRNLKLSENNKEVTYVEEDQSYPDHDHRFDYWPQLLCTNSLTGRCYWEVEWRGEVHIAVAYGGMTRKGDSDDVRFGRTDKCWSLYCCDGVGYYAGHNYTSRAISVSSTADSHKVAVYVDCNLGTMSFYNVFSNTRIHLHTFNTTFSEPVYAAFRVKPPHSSVCLCADSEY